MEIISDSRTSGIYYGRRVCDKSTNRACMPCDILSIAKVADMHANCDVNRQLNINISMGYVNLYFTKTAFSDTLQLVA